MFKNWAESTMKQRFKQGKVFDIKELLLIIFRCDVDVVVMLKHSYLWGQVWSTVYYGLWGKSSFYNFKRLKASKEYLVS